MTEWGNARNSCLERLRSETLQAVRGEVSKLPCQGKRGFCRTMFVLNQPAISLLFEISRALASVSLQDHSAAS